MWHGNTCVPPTKSPSETLGSRYKRAPYSCSRSVCCSLCMLLSFSHSLPPSLSLYALSLSLLFTLYLLFNSCLLGHFQAHWLTVDFVVYSLALPRPLISLSLFFFCRSVLRHTFAALHFSLLFFLSAFGLFTFSRSNSPLVLQVSSSKILSQLQTRTH